MLRLPLVVRQTGVLVDAATVAAFVSLPIALGSLWFTYVSSRRLQQRQDLLAWVNRQLSELYGPLQMILASSRATYAAFCDAYFPLHEFQDAPEQITPEHREAWKLWFLTVLQPLNRRGYELVVANGDLLLGDILPDCVAQYCAHVTSFDVVLAGWSGGSNELFPAIPYPGEFGTYVTESYGELKSLQRRLIRSRH